MMDAAHFAGLFFIALLMFFGFVGLYRGAKWRDKQNEIYNSETDEQQD